MTLLFITQKLHGQDAFGVLWIRAFIRQGYSLKVICLEGSPMREEVSVHSLGKENGATRLQSILRFEHLILSLQYDRVFIHMAPVWYALGGWYWLLRRMPVYLWYTHYKMQLGVWLFGIFGKRFFCATPQSLPQYQGSPKKVVVGHGIDLAYWPQRPNVAADPYRLLIVHRLSRSKRLEIIFHALPLLDARYRLDVYGIEAEPTYVAELKSLVVQLQLGSRVTFHGTIPMDWLPDVYVRHRLILNMASETIDKTMLEAMTCGCYPVTTKRNAEALALRPEGYGRQNGIFKAPTEDTPEAIALFIETWRDRLPLSADAMYQVVAEHHSLKALIATMDHFIRSGR